MQDLDSKRRRCLNQRVYFRYELNYARCWTNAYSREGLAILAGQYVRKKTIFDMYNAVPTVLRTKSVFPTPSLDMNHVRELV
jgi:hypothetical protein